MKDMQAVPNAQSNTFEHILPRTLLRILPIVETLLHLTNRPSLEDQPSQLLSYDILANNIFMGIVGRSREICPF